MTDPRAEGPTWAGEILTIDAQDGTRIQVGIAETTEPKKGPVVLLIHGISSHMGWYEPLAKAFVDCGATVFVPDRRGSGSSDGPRGHMPRWRTVAMDLETVAEVIRARHPGQPLHVLGVSLGAVIACASALRRPDLFASLILATPALYARIKVPLKRRLKVFRKSITRPTRLFDLPFGTKELTGRADLASAVSADPRRLTKISARFAVETFRMQRWVRARIGTVDIPVHVLLAENDAVVDNARLTALFESGRVPRLWIDTFEGAQHLLSGDLTPEEMAASIAPWIRDHHAPDSPPRRRSTVRRPPRDVMRDLP